VALSLDLDPRHAVGDLTQHWDRLDATMLQQAVVEHAAGVNVLAHKPETQSVPPLDPQPMQQTLLLLKALFEYVVLDLGHVLDGSVLEAVKLSENILIVVRLDVPCLRLTRKLLHQLTVQHSIPLTRISVVANKYGQRRQIAWRQAEETLGVKLLEGIPDDPATLNQAVNQGQPLIRTSRRAGITRSFDKLADRLNGKV
jgi:pilus assembly protein CpaE